MILYKKIKTKANKFKGDKLCHYAVIHRTPIQVHF